MKSLLLSIVLFPFFSSAQSNNGVHTESAANGLIDNLNIKLFSIQSGGAKFETDGTRAKFGSTYCGCVDGDDAVKFMGSGIENISLLRNGVSLAIEARPYISNFDTLFLYMEGMNIGGNYEFQTTTVNFDTSIASCKLIDKFLNTSSTISFSDTTKFPFDITTDVNSYATDRFYIVLATSAALPINTISVSAYKNNNTAMIHWETTAENNIKLFDIEKSVDGIRFTKVSEVVAKNSNKTNQYNYTDLLMNETNYYRIKAIQTNNKGIYSSIAKVVYNNNIAKMMVYPNPLSSNTVTIQLTNIEAGYYTVNLLNMDGQAVWVNNMYHNGNNSTINLQFNNKLSVGNYQLQLTNVKGNTYKQSVIVIE
jgi:hypothetical protein